LTRIKLLRRDRDPKDGRRSKLTLTPAGRQINARRAGTVEAAVQRALAQVPPSKLGAIEDVLKLIATELNAAEQ
jgi:DNA-binding MarR family transcriptional regulator